MEAGAVNIPTFTREEINKAIGFIPEPQLQRKVEQACLQCLKEERWSFPSPQDWTFSLFDDPFFPSFGALDKAFRALNTPSSLEECRALASKDPNCQVTFHRTTSRLGADGFVEEETEEFEAKDGQVIKDDRNVSRSERPLGWKNDAPVATLTAAPAQEASSVGSSTTDSDEETGLEDLPQT